MTRLKGCAFCLVSSGFTFARRLGLGALLSKADQLGLAINLDHNGVGFAAGMVRRPNGLVVALELVTAAFDHFRLGAELSSDRFFRTGLPVLSDLIATTGSSAVPRRVTVPPLGPLIE
jgi:hypothetical protein